MAALAIDQVSVGYRDKLVVRRVTLAVEPGEVLGLLGPNGAGKTTLVSAIEGLIAVQSGAITIAGHPWRSTEAKQALGVMLQHNAFPELLTVQEIVRLFAGLYGLNWQWRDVARWLQRWQLDSVAKDRPGTLSGGLQQRVALAISLINDPAVIVLDEPTTGLDPESRRHLWSHIREAQAEGAAVLLTTHSMEEATALAHRVAFLVNGVIVDIGTVPELIQRHQGNPAVQPATPGVITLEDIFMALVKEHQASER
ncbi:MAG: ABC transporter ATP-binding protein [Firmicutes bacterium]|nr:ABC transporter ATP-binding protein [Bacillota bacterium]